MDKPPVIFNAIKPIETEYHLVKILIIITSVNAIEPSIPCRVRNPARLPSTTPIPNGKSDATPRIIDAVYVGTNVKNSNVSMLKDNKIKYTVIDSTNQNNADKLEL